MQLHALHSMYVEVHEIGLYICMHAFWSGHGQAHRPLQNMAALAVCDLMHPLYVSTVASPVTDVC